MYLFLALLLDWYVGDPERIWKRITHPIVIIGNIIGFLDRQLNNPDLGIAANRQRGIVALGILLTIALGAGYLIANMLDQLGFLGGALEIVLVAVFLAQKSLADHVAFVASSIRSDGIEAGRAAVSQIVGRNTDELDESGVCRAAIESLAENFSDGVVAPVFWYALFGLPGLIAYKAVNTADSMIGHKNSQYESFGRATALFDDWVNWPAARISAGLISIGSAVRHGWTFGKKVLSQTMQTAGTHRSPNAGWPEAAMAASLGISLGGPRSYGETSAAEPYLNAGARQQLTISDIDRALEVFSISCVSLWVIIAIFAFI